MKKSINMDRLQFIQSIITLILSFFIPGSTLKDPEPEIKPFEYPTPEFIGEFDHEHLWLECWKNMMKDQSQKHLITK